MILADSRYVNGSLVPQADNTITVRRTFPNPTARNTVLYTWKQSDRIDRIAARYLGDPTLWWKIMDVNPLIQAVGDIRPGMQIRIPNRV